MESFSGKRAERLTVSAPPSPSVQTDLEAGITAALMKVQPSSEPDLAAQHRALQLGEQRKGIHRTESSPLLLLL